MFFLSPSSLCEMGSHPISPLLLLAGQLHYSRGCPVLLALGLLFQVVLVEVSDRNPPGGEWNGQDLTRPGCWRGLDGPLQGAEAMRGYVRNANLASQMLERALRKKNVRHEKRDAHIIFGRWRLKPVEFYARGNMDEFSVEYTSFNEDGTRMTVRQKDRPEAPFLYYSPI